MDHDSLDRERVETLTQTLLADFRRRGVDVHTAEDMLQEAWLRTLRKRRRPAHLEAWLRVVGARVLVDHVRKSESRQRHEHLAGRCVERTAPPPRLDSKILRLVEDLPDPYARVVRLRYLEDRSFAEIARLLGRSEATIRSQLKRGLEHLRTRIEGRSDREPAWALVLSFLRGLRSLPRALRALSLVSGSLAAGLMIAFLSRPERPRADAVEVSVHGATPPATLASTPSTALGGRIPLAGGAAPIPDGEGTLALSRPAAGIVRGPDTIPRAGAQVFRGRSDARAGELVATTDANGRFSLARVDSSDFLWAADPEHLPSRRVHVLSGRDGQPVDLRLEAPAGRLTLRLRDRSGAPLAHRTVALDWDRAEVPPVLMDGEGVLQTPTRSLASVTDAAGYVVLPVPARELAHLRVHRAGEPSLSQVIRLEPGEQALELALADPLVLAGEVIDARGAPAGNARVEALQDDRRLVVETRTDERGRYVLTGLEPGPCELRAVEDPAHGTDSAATKVLLGADALAASRLELSPRLTLRGRVSRWGAPIAGASVVRIGLLGEDARALTDAEGRFSLPCCTQAEYRLAIYEPGRYWPVHQASGLRPGVEPVELHLDSVPRLATLVLEFENEDAASIPSMVELGVVRTANSMLRAVDRARRRCELEAPAGEEICLLLWIPGLGSLNLQRSRLEGNEVRRIRIPTPAHMTFLVEFPEDVPGTPIRGRVGRSGFGNAFLATRYGTIPQYELEPGPDGRTFTTRVLPGEASYSFLAEGMTHRPLRLNAQAGATLSEVVRLVPSVPAEVSVRVGAGRPTPRVDLELADGTTAPCWPRATHREGEQAVFLVDLPPDARRIVVSTKDRTVSASVQPGHLAGGAPPRIELDLIEPLEPGQSAASSSK